MKFVVSSVLRVNTRQIFVQTLRQVNQAVTVVVVTAHVVRATLIWLQKLQSAYSHNLVNNYE